jgi:plasmid stability protein
MPTLTVRNLDKSVYEGLKKRATRAGRSMEEEARIILERGTGDWWAAWVSATEEARGENLPIPQRSSPRRVDLG